MKVDQAITILFLFSIVLPISASLAKSRTLDCVGINESQNFTLKAVSINDHFKKIVFTHSSGERWEYLVEGIKKIPVGNEKALFGSLLVTPNIHKKQELMLEPDNNFEMYNELSTDRPHGSANTIFIFNHHKPALEILNLQTGKRTQSKSNSQGRIAFVCDNFPDYLRYIELIDPKINHAELAWNRIIESRMRAVSEKFTTAYIDNNLVFDNQFMGVETWQNPFDMWIFQQIISEIKPDVIIETGTAHGGSTLFFSTILEKVNPHGQIITVEIDPEVDKNIQKARSFPVFNEHVRLIKGDSVSSQTINQIQHIIDELTIEKNARNGSTEKSALKVLITLDSLHSTEHVQKELKLYSKFVSDGSYIVVQDTIIDQNPKFLDWFVRPWVQGATAGPAVAVADFLEANSEFQSDRRWEKYYFTFYRGGFLRKMR